MLRKTVLEEMLWAHEEYCHVMDVRGTPAEVQSVLDRITPSVCAQLSPEDIVNHVLAVYYETATIYADLPEHKHVPDALLEFMNLPHFREGDRVIDLGCGPIARDAIFMSCMDKKERSLLMGRIEKGLAARHRFEVPNIGFDVVAVDGSSRIVSLAEQRLATKKDGWRQGGSHFFRSHVLFADMHDVSKDVHVTCNGAWSCASLFTHTPKPLVFPALISVASTLKQKGVFGVSYSGSSGGAYDNLRYSRTGRVKYFSRPEAGFIASEAKKAGFSLMYESHADLHMGGKIQKNFFTTQFFQKG